MFGNRFEIKYDAEYDVLHIYNRAKRSNCGIEWGNIDISYSGRGEIVNLSFNDASNFFTNITGKKISVDDLREIDSCILNIKNEKGIIYIAFKLCVKKVPKIDDVIAIKSLNYCSPVLSK